MRRVNFSGLKFSEATLLYDDAVQGVQEFTPSAENFSLDGKLKVHDAEKDSERKCVRLEI